MILDREDGQIVRSDAGEVETLPQPPRGRIAELAAYWESKRHNRFAPKRADIDPTEIRQHVGRLFMVDVLPDGDYRYRLLGSELVQRMGRDSTGKRFSKLYAGQPHAFELLKQRFDEVVTTRQPSYSRGKVYWLGAGEYRNFECGFFPLSDDGRTVNIILAEMHLYWPK